MTVSSIEQKTDKALLMRSFLKRIVNNDLRAKQLFRLYYDRAEITEEQFFRSLKKYQ